MKSSKIHVTKASFIIRGLDLDPEFWTRFFGVTPDRSVKKGEHLRLPNGTLARHPSSVGFWIFAPEPDRTTLAIDGQVSALLGALRLPDAKFRQVLMERNETCIISVFVFNDNGMNPPVYSKATARLAAACSAEIEMDVYD